MVSASSWTRLIVASASARSGASLVTSLTLAPPPSVARYDPGYPARSRSLLLHRSLATTRDTRLAHARSSSIGRSLRPGIPASLTLAGPEHLSHDGAGAGAVADCDRVRQRAVRQHAAAGIPLDEHLRDRTSGRAGPRRGRVDDTVEAPDEE